MKTISTPRERAFRKVLGNKRTLPLFFMILGWVGSGGVSQASDRNIPPVLASLQASLVDLKPLGTIHGLQVWEAQKEGKRRTLYVTQDGEALLVGELFDEKGPVSSITPSSPYQQGKDAGNATDQVEAFWNDIEQSAWFKMGDESAPSLFAVLDPSCEYCLKMVETLSPLVEAHKLQLRIILVSFLGERSEKAAAQILGSRDPAQAFLSFKRNPRALGEEPSGSETMRKVEHNNELLMKWGITATPLSVFKAKNGKVKVIEGLIQNPVDLLGG